MCTRVRVARNTRARAESVRVEREKARKNDRILEVFHDRRSYTNTHTTHHMHDQKRANNNPTQIKALWCVQPDSVNEVENSRGV